MTSMKEQLVALREGQLLRQLEGPCPRCAFSRLIVFRSADRIERVELVDECPEEMRTVDRILYCPNCGALHEIGGETTYPQSGVVGIPEPVDEADVIPLRSIPWLTKKKM